MARHEFCLHFQPVIRMIDRAVVGAEALARWAHPERGILGANEFIESTERSGLIVALGSTLLSEGLSQLRAWGGQLDGTGFTLSINVSARQFERPGFAALVLSLLHAMKLDPLHLCLELTETAVVRNIDSIKANLSHMRAAGIGVAVDDFGTGYTSLSLLRDLDFSVLKIDRAFVARIVDNPHDRKLLQALVSMARSLELSVVAEGVETNEQAELLCEMECPLAQGFFYGPAVPAHDFQAEHLRPLPSRFRDLTSYEELGGSTP